MILRVLFVITDSGIGGAEKALLSLLKNLDRTRFEPCGVFVVKGRREMAERWASCGVPVRVFGMGRYPNPLKLASLLLAINAANPDIVHALMFHSIQYARLARRRARWTLVTSPRVSYRHFPRAAVWADERLRRGDELAVCESNAGRKELLGRGYPEERIRVAPNGVDTQAYARDISARARLRAEWGVSDEHLVVGAVGRLHPQKGYDLLIRAAAELASSKVPFRVMIAGEGHHLKDLTRLAQNLSVPVTFLGRRNDVSSLLSAFDIYVQSSRYEGMSNALLEALAAGLPCAATAVDGTLDFAKDGENMLLIKPDDATSLAVGIGFLLEKPGLRERLSENATITARNQSVERMVRSFEEAYNDARPIS